MLYQEGMAVEISALVQLTEFPPPMLYQRARYDEVLSNWQKIHDSYTADCLEHYNKGKTDAAREIFEGIGKILYKYDKIAERDRSEYGELIVGDIASAIAEFKKNYPISTEIVRDLAEYAVDQDIQNYKENK